MVLVLQIQQQVQTLIQSLQFLRIHLNAVLFLLQLAGNVFQFQQTAVDALAQFRNVFVVCTDTVTVVLYDLQAMQNVFLFFLFQKLDVLIQLGFDGFGVSKQTDMLLYVFLFAII